MKLNTKEITICALFSAITALLSQISIPIPFTTVPLTMQVFAVAISGVLLGAKKGFISQLIYMLMGSIGLPVFAQMSGGLSIVLGPTGGFILGFPLMALVIGYFSKKYNKTIYILIGMIIGIIIDYLIGTILFVFVTKSTFMQGLMMCVVPFIVVDLIKIGLATVIGITLSKRLKLEANIC